MEIAKDRAKPGNLELRVSYTGRSRLLEDEGRNVSGTEIFKTTEFGVHMSRQETLSYSLVEPCRRLPKSAFPHQVLIVLLKQDLKRGFGYDRLSCWHGADAAKMTQNRIQSP
jgi:hypothetical protein